MADDPRTRCQALAGEDVPLLFLEPADQYDPCIVGVVVGFGGAITVLYDHAAVIASLIAEGMSDDEASEWFEFNMIGGFHGPHTPMYLLKGGD